MFTSRISILALNIVPKMIMQCLGHVFECWQWLTLSHYCDWQKEGSDTHVSHKCDAPNCAFDPPMTHVCRGVLGESLQLIGALEKVLKLTCKLYLPDCRKIHFPRLSALCQFEMPHIMTNQNIGRTFGLFMLVWPFNHYWKIIATVGAVGAAPPTMGKLGLIIKFALLLKWSLWLKPPQPGLYNIWNQLKS